MDNPKWYRKALGWVWNSWVTPVLVSVAGAGLLAIRSSAGLSTVQLVVACCQVVGAFIVSWAGLHWVVDRSKRVRLANPTQDDIMRLVEGWALRFGYTVSRLEPSEGADWRVVIESPGIPKKTIMHEKGKPWVTVSTRIGLTEAQLAQLDADPELFAQELGLRMFPLDIEWQLMTKNVTERGVLLVAYIVFDGALHPLQFLRTVGQVDRAFKYAVIVLKRLNDGFAAQPKTLGPSQSS